LRRIKQDLNVLLVCLGSSLGNLINTSIEEGLALDEKFIIESCRNWLQNVTTQQQQQQQHHHHQQQQQQSQQGLFSLFALANMLGSRLFSSSFSKQRNSILPSLTTLNPVVISNPNLFTNIQDVVSSLKSMVESSSFSKTEEQSKK